MSRKPRKQYSGQEKVAILRERLLEGKPLSEVCERHQLQPTVFYAWQKQFFENGAAAFERRNIRATEAKDRQLAVLPLLEPEFSCARVSIARGEPDVPKTAKAV
jgi:transposase